VLARGGEVLLARHLVAYEIAGETCMSVDLRKAVAIVGVG